jgi:hypothetical protein
MAQISPVCGKIRQWSFAAFMQIFYATCCTKLECWRKKQAGFFLIKSLAKGKAWRFTKKRSKVCTMFCYAGKVLNYSFEEIQKKIKWKALEL